VSYSHTATLWKGTRCLKPPEAICTTIAQRFAQVAHSPEQEKKFPVGPASAKKLGYDPTEIDALPLSVTDSFCGVGNPLSLGDLTLANPTPSSYNPLC